MSFACLAFRSISKHDIIPSPSIKANTFGIAGFHAKFWIVSPIASLDKRKGGQIGVESGYK